MNSADQRADAIAPAHRDRWARWLLRNRFGGDAAARDRMLAKLAEIRDKVLRAADIHPGDVVLDVGCGDGLLAVGALDHVADSGRVIFSDISEELLDRCREITQELGLSYRCEFIHTGLPDLGAIAGESVDVAMTRSVLIYVKDKRASFAALHRVLRPGGRLSIFEPINSFCYPPPANQLFGFDITGLEDLGDKVKRAYSRHQPAGNAMVDFDERDLLSAAEHAGFTEIRLTYQVDIKPQDQTADDWDHMLRLAPNPLVPPLGQIVAEALSPEEQTRLAAHVTVRGKAPERNAVAYLSAIRYPSREIAELAGQNTDEGPPNR